MLFFYSLKRRNHIFLKLIFVVILLFSMVDSIAQTVANTIRFNKPATHFTQALPLGNGRLGAMVFGGTNTDKIVLNEISMWSGGVENPNKADAYKYLPEIQQLLQQEKNKEAQQLLQKHFTSAGKGSGYGQGAKVKYGCYQVLANLLINWHDTTATVSNYNRSLLLTDGIANTTWTRNGVSMMQEVIASAPQQCIIVRLKAQPRGLNFDIQLERKEAAAFQYTGNNIIMQGQLNGGNGDKGVKFAGIVKVFNTGGTIVPNNNKLTVKNAGECIIIISAATNLNWPDVAHPGPEPLPVVQQRINKAALLQWKKLLENHVNDFTKKYYLSEFYLGKNTRELNTDKEQWSITQTATPDRILNYAAGKPDKWLPVLYYNFGRYLLISSSAPGNLPANLQGLWAEEYQTPWNGDYHLNINIQMNYWPAEVTNLGYAHLPLIEFTRQLVQPGSITAQTYYNAPGWVAHVISNPWKFTAPGEGADWGSTLTGGAWLCNHLWQHYLYNPDINYLKKIYPVLKGAAQFYKSILITDPKTGWLVTAPSNSPENTYITETGFKGQTTMGPTMDMQIGRELLGNTIKAAALLNTDKLFTDSLQIITKKLAPNRISEKTGGLMEWIRDYDEAEPTHRHVSHLYGLHPFDEIDVNSTPELAAAAKKTLLLRGDGGTGWSRAWKITFWARLQDGDHALKVLQGLLMPAFEVKNGLMSNRGAGTYPNLFCSHPPFQIDGNFGATAAIAEMLLQSHGVNNVIRYLPALPGDSAWQEGTVKNFRAANGFQTSFSWQNHRLTGAEITSLYGKTCYVQLPEGMKVYTAKGALVKVTQLQGGIGMFTTGKRQKYTIR